MAKGIFRRLGTLRLAKAAEDCPHSKTLTRLSEAPLGSIATPVKRKLSCYSILAYLTFFSWTIFPMSLLSFSWSAAMSFNPSNEFISRSAISARFSSGVTILT